MKKLFCMICTAAALQGFLAHAAENEWAFDAEPAGSELSQAVNYGLSPTNFAAGFGATLFTTNKTLLYIGAAVADPWNNGAILDATVSSKLSGTNYLRYDLKYSITNRLQNWTQKMFGVYFTDATGAKAAGMVLGYDINSLNTDPLKPANRTVTAVATNLLRQGSLAVISEVSLDTQTLRVWYSFDGTFNYDSPSYVTSVTLDSIDALRIHATGDFPEIGENDFVSMDHIRQSSSWSEIIEDLPTVTVPNLQVTMVSPLPVMDVGDTNEMVFVIKNMGCSATNVSSVLFKNPASGSFSVISNNAPVNLPTLRSVTNTYQIVAHSAGTYQFTLRATNTQTSTQTNVPVVVGEEVRYISHTVEEVSGGVMPDAYEPGEQLRVTVLSQNSGAKTVGEVTTSLSAPASFSAVLATNSTNRFYSVEVGHVITSVYNVAISSSVKDGDHVFKVVNQSSIAAWTNSFVIPVLNRWIVAVTPESLLFDVVSGESVTKTCTLKNTGNKAVSYTISDNGLLPFSGYHADKVSQPMVSFPPVLNRGDQTVFTNWYNELGTPVYLTEPSSIGFNFPFYGKVVTNFTIFTDGRIFLSGQDVSGYVVPYQRDVQSNTNQIRCVRENGRIGITWGADFQAWLHSDGRILFLYGVGLFDSSKVWLNRENGATNLLSVINSDISVGNGRGVMLSAYSWVTYAPTNGVLDRLSQTEFTVTANAPSLDDRSETFEGLKVSVKLRDGTLISVPVVVNKNQPKAGLKVTKDGVTPTESVAFSGTAGGLPSYTNVKLVNTGDVALAYTIINRDARDAGFITYLDKQRVWVDGTPSDSGDFGSFRTGLMPLLSDLRTGGQTQDSGYTPLIPIGFEFPFAGKIYTNLSLGVDGGISLGESRPMTVRVLVRYRENLFKYIKDGTLYYIAKYVNYNLYNNVLSEDGLSRITNSVPLRPDSLWVNEFSSENLTWTNPVPPYFIAPFWSDLVLGDNSDISFKRSEDEFVATWHNMQEYTNSASDLTFRAILSSDGTIRFQYKTMRGDSVSHASSGLKNTYADGTNTAYSITDYPVGNLVDVQFITNYVVTVTNRTDGTNEYSRLVVVTNVVDIIPTGAFSAMNGEVRFEQPGQLITVDPKEGRIAVYGEADLVICGDPRNLTVLGGATNLVSNFIVQSRYTTNNLMVSFDVTNAASAGVAANVDASSDSGRLLFGSDGVINVAHNADGSRTISWPRPEIGKSLTRSFTVEYTTNLLEGWKVLAVLKNRYSYTDTQHTDEPMIYYRVTVQ